MAYDRFGRKSDNLWISLTDDCNLRCIYTKPEEMKFRPAPELMQDEEILAVVDLFARLGFDKIHLTGGEPTMRTNLLEIVRGIASTTGVQEIAMTTNGVLLPLLATPLAAAGLTCVNINLDTLDSNKFIRLTRHGDIEEVWEGILAAEKAGLMPIKIYSFIVRGYNEEEIAELARITIDHPWQIRFIEMMPFDGVTELQTNQLVTTAEMMAAVEKTLGPLDPAVDGLIENEAYLYHIPGAKGEIGFISSYSSLFCTHCSRARITAAGTLRMCRLHDYEVDLLSPLRQGASLEELRMLVVNAVWNKPWGHGLAHGAFSLNHVM